MMTRPGCEHPESVRQQSYRIVFFSVPLGSTRHHSAPFGTTRLHSALLGTTRLNPILYLSKCPPQSCIHSKLAVNASLQKSPQNITPTF